MQIDAAIDALVAALTRLGLEPPSAPADTRVLRELERELAPMRLPADVRRWWERVDAHTLRVETYPQLHGPDFALACWRSARDEFRQGQPLALLQIGYSSQQCMSVELGVDDRPGGALFEWYLVDGGFTRRFDALADWLVQIRRQLERGHEQATLPWLGEIGRDILEWPAHWQRSSGLNPEDLELRGATHTIAELSPTDEPIAATIVGQVVSLAGTAAATGVRVDDGTAKLDVICPYETTLLGPAHRGWYEFDVIVEPGQAAATATAVRRSSHG